MHQCLFKNKSNNVKNMQVDVPATLHCWTRRAQHFRFLQHSETTQVTESIKELKNA